MATPIGGEVSFVGHVFSACVRPRHQLDRRLLYCEAGLGPSRFTFGHNTITLVEHLGQLKPIDDWRM